MVYWYVVAQCEWLGPNFGQSEYLDMGGYTEGTMGSQNIQTDGDIGDPFLSYGIDTETWAYGQAQMEIGLIGSHRIRINSSGVRIWTAGDVWKDPLTEGGGAEGEWFKTITGITNDIIAEQVDDTLTISSANNRLTIIGNSETDTINFTLVEANINHNALTNYAANRHFLQSEISITESQISNLNHLTEGEISLSNLLEKSHASLTNVTANQHIDNLTDIPTRNHNDLLNLNVGDAYEHITQAQKDELHAIYTLEVHDNTKHNPNYANELIEIIAGTGLTGGGTLQANRTINCSITQYTNTLAVAALAAKDDYIKNDENDETTGDLTVANLITAGNVDGVDVSVLNTKHTALREQSVAFPGAPSEGDFHYDEDDDSLYRYNAEAEAWIEVGASGVGTQDTIGNYIPPIDITVSANWGMGANNCLWTIHHQFDADYMYFAFVCPETRDDWKIGIYHGSTSAARTDAGHIYVIEAAHGEAGTVRLNGVAMDLANPTNNIYYLTSSGTFTGTEGELLNCYWLKDTDAGSFYLKMHGVYLYH